MAGYIRLACGALFVVACGGGCDSHRIVNMRHTHTPRVVVADSPGPLPARTTAVAAGGSAGSGNDSREDPPFGFRHVTGVARVRQGLGHGLEASGEGYAGKGWAGSSLCEDIHGRYADSSWHMGSGRGGLKWAPRVTSDFLALTGGYGGGSNTQTGGYHGYDLGLSLGYENNEIVPFFNGSLVGTFPFASRATTLIDCSNSSSILVDYTPDATLHFQGSAGFKVPMRPSMLGSLVVQPTFYAAIGWVLPTVPTFTLTAGIELSIGRRPGHRRYIGHQRLGERDWTVE